MPDVLPTINNEPAQGIQATLDVVYLWNPDVANELIEQINVLLEKLEGVSGTIKPYDELEAPIKQYTPMFYGDGLYVAKEDMDEIPATVDLSQWILVATKATDLVAGSGIVIHDGVISVTQAISEGAAAGATAVQPEDLGTAAYAAATDFATSAQGGKADTAVQPGDLGTAAYAATTDFATSAQGAKADTALQPGSSVPQYSTMPVASADNLGEVVQYVGAPASGYATGYFYKCVNNDDVYTWENVNVQAEPNIGRFLSLWNCATGLAETNPPQSPYTYKAGDYFIVGTVSSATPAVNYKPNGSSYVIGTASSTVESGEVYAGDSYFFDGTNWRLQSNTTRTVTFANIAGDIYDNESAAGALNAKQAALVSGTNIKTINGNSILGSGNIALGAKDVNALPQYSTLPVASSSNSGDIVQYTGETISEAEASATISQTTGSGLTDLTVDTETFEAEEQPSGAETVAFTASVVPDSMIFKTVVGNTTFSITNPRTFKDYMTNTHSSWYEGYANAVFRYDSSYDDWLWLTEDMTGQYGTYSTAQLEEMGIIITGTPANDDTISYVYTDAIVSWSKNSETVDISDYGITYSGEPVTGDVLTVSYTPAVEGRDHAYIYESVPEYSDPVATISQTVGSGLSNLSVNVDTFVEKEQPTQSENVAFVASVTADDTSLGTQVGTFACGLNSAEFLAKLVATWGNEWWNILGTKNPYFVYTNDGWALSSQDGPSTISDPGAFVKAYSVANTDWGFYVTEDSALQVGDYVSVIYTEGSTTWSKNGTTVSLAKYGISYSGTTADGDTITVAYTAPTVTDYKWTQTNVQPSSGSGGGEGIEWKTKVDLPGEYQGDLYEVSPTYTIRGGLPDGNYEFYFSVKTTTETTLMPLGELVYKASIRLNNSNNTAYGRFGYVFNGDYMNDGNNVYGYGTTLWGLFYKKDGDIILFTKQRPWATAVLAYNDHATVPECFKLSAIKNVDTGEEFIAEGYVDSSGSWPSYDYGYSGEFKLAALCNEPEQTRHHLTADYMFGSETQYFYLGAVINNRKVSPSCSEVDISLSSSSGGRWHCIVENSAYGYIAKVLHASGDMANAQIGWNDYGNAYIYLNTQTSGSVSISLGYKGSSQSCALYPEAPSTFTQMIITKVGGTIYRDNLGLIEQYTGATNGTYTNGYFYKANGTVVVTPDTMQTTVLIPAGEATVTIDTTNWMNALAANWGWTLNDIRRWLNEYSSAEWSLNYDVDNAVITSMWVPFIGDVSDSNILQWVTVTYTGTDTGITRITYTESFTPASETIQNTSWDRVDVQPGGGSGGGAPVLTWYTVSTAGSTLTIADTSSATLVKIYKNGLLLEPTADYSISGTTLTMVTALVVGDKITTEVF